MARLLEMPSASMNSLNGEMGENKRNTDVEPEVMKGDEVPSIQEKGKWLER